METYLNIEGQECVKWSDENGDHSMLKSAWEELEAQKELGGTLGTNYAQGAN